MRKVVAAVVCGLVVFVSLIAQDGPETVVRGTKQFRQSEVVTGLAGPFEVTWGPDNMLWVTERTGKRITRVNPTTGEKKVAVTIDEVLAPAGRPETSVTGLPSVSLARSYVKRTIFV